MTKKIDLREDDISMLIIALLYMPCAQAQEVQRRDLIIKLKENM